MQVESDPHFSEELLEKYAMGRMAEEQTQPLEEHLLLCSECQTRVALLDDYVGAAKTAAAALERKKAVSRPRLLDNLAGRLWQIPRPVWALGLAAAITIAVVIPMRQQETRQTEVYLSTVRGSDTNSSAAGKILFNIDLSTVAALPAYQLQLVDSVGSEIWKSRVLPQNNQILAPVPVKLRTGRYWVRLYSEADSAHPLQEFALNIE